MFWRITAAIAALTWFHGANNIARDGSQIAAELRNEVPRAAVDFCLDKPELCQKVLARAAGLADATPAQPISTTMPSTNAGMNKSKAEAPARAEPETRPAPAPVAAGTFPLPPVRPLVLISMPPARKGA